MEMTAKCSKPSRCWTRRGQSWAQHNVTKDEDKTRMKKSYARRRRGGEGGGGWESFKLDEATIRTKARKSRQRQRQNRQYNYDEQARDSKIHKTRRQADFMFHHVSSCFIMFHEISSIFIFDFLMLFLYIDKDVTWYRLSGKIMEPPGWFGDANRWAGHEDTGKTCRYNCNTFCFKGICHFKHVWEQFFYYLL